MNSVQSINDKLLHANLVDGIQNELAETSSKSFTFARAPFVLALAVEMVSPQTVHQLGRLYLELGSIDLSKLLKRECPAMETGAEPNCTIGRVHLNVSQWTIFITVGGNNDIQRLNDSCESLVQVLLVHLTKRNPTARTFAVIIKNKFACKFTRKSAAQEDNACSPEAPTGHDPFCSRMLPA